MPPRLPLSPSPPLPVSAPGHRSISHAHGRLTLIGTIHADQLGFPRMESLLRSLQPDLIFVELSLYGKDFRSSNQVSMLKTLDRNLRVAARKGGLSFKEALAHPEIKALRRQIVLPFEYRAAWRYSRSRGTKPLLVDFSSLSRKMISSWPEMLSLQNLDILLSLPRDGRLTIPEAYDLAAMSIRKETSTKACLAQPGYSGTDLVWEERECHIAGVIHSVLRKSRPMRPVYLGGWQHLTVGGNFSSLRELLEINLHQCCLLDRGFF